MAKKVDGYIKLQIPAGNATPAPPVGPALDRRALTLWISASNSTPEQPTRQV